MRKSGTMMLMTIKIMMKSTTKMKRKSMKRKKGNSVIFRYAMLPMARNVMRYRHVLIMCMDSQHFPALCFHPSGRDGVHLYLVLKEVNS